MNKYSWLSVSLKRFSSKCSICSTCSTTKRSSRSHTRLTYLKSWNLSCRWVKSWKVRANLFLMSMYDIFVWSDKQSLPPKPTWSIVQHVNFIIRMKIRSITKVAFLRIFCSGDCIFCIFYQSLLCLGTIFHLYVCLSFYNCLSYKDNTEQ